MKSLNDKIYQDKFIRCRCGFPIGETRLDGQCLLLESGLVVFNYISVQCPNGHNLSWLAPLLPNEKETVDNCAPNIKHIEARAAGIREHFNSVRRRENYGIYLHKAGKYVVTVGGYIGSYETFDEAKAVRDVELAKNLGYKPKDKQTDTQPQNQFSAS